MLTRIKSVLSRGRRIRRQSSGRLPVGIGVGVPGQCSGCVLELVCSCTGAVSEQCSGALCSCTLFHLRVLCSLDLTQPVAV